MPLDEARGGPEQPAGDARERIGRLYDTCADTLYRYALMLLADPGTAEDAVQQVFLSLLRGGGVIDRGLEFHYLRRAVRNECYSMLRSKRRRRRFTAGGAVDDVRGAVKGGLLEAHDPRATTEQRLALEEAIHTLTPEQREVLHLHVFEGMTFQEVAEITGESRNTTASRYRYGLERLRKTLAPSSVRQPEHR